MKKHLKITYSESDVEDIIKSITDKDPEKVIIEWFESKENRLLKYL